MIRKITFKELPDGWQLSLGGGSRKRKNIRGIFNVFEKRLPRLIAKNEGNPISVRVVYADGGDNETLRSNDFDYLTYTASCFLENFLSEYTQKRITRRWVKDIESKDYL